jgi:hypothetical protein
MNRSRAVAVLIAVLSVSALGVAATTLEATLSSEPDDAINPDWDRLPIGEDDAATIQEEIADGSGDGETKRSDPGDGNAETGGAGDGGDDARSAGEIQQEASANGREGEHADSSGGGDERSSAASSGLETASGTDVWTSMNGLQALPSSRLRLPLALVGVFVTGAVAYRYRATLRALLGSASASGSADAPISDAESWPGVEPSNVVDRAWLTMMDRVDPERPETMTTAECAALAREQGADAAATEAIITAFERVHYGARPVAEEAPRARSGLRRLDGDEG